MAEILTSKGMMDEALLSFATGGEEDDRAVIRWEEWRDATGEIVKRNVHVDLKHGLDLAGIQGGF